jgi:H+/Cl- antiporter ClcA
MFRWNPREHWLLGAFVFKWLVLATPLAFLVGSSCALFLWALEKATLFREGHPWLLFLLPFAGMGIVALYQRVGERSEGGNNLLLDEIHQPGGGVPRRMALLVLFATVITHLFGGSAGREGTAVQMGGSIASGLGRFFRLDASDTRLLLMCGIAAGFAGVFGTPLAGTVFALEVLVIGRLNYEAVFPCLIAALVGDWACSIWGIHHTHYAISPHSAPQLAGISSQNVGLFAKVALASVAFGLASVLFAELTHGLGHFWKRTIQAPLLRPAVGAFCLIALTFVLGTRDYLGLGVSSSDPHAVTIVSCFRPEGAQAFSWWWKLLFTALTLSCGFKGGEVTPLFFIGAALGNTLAHWLGAPVDLFAGLGFIAVFAGATNTPLACTLMGIELFGSHYAPFFMLACFVAYGFSGHSGIYASQRVGVSKVPLSGVTVNTTLREVRETKGVLGLWKKDR